MEVGTFQSISKVSPQETGSVITGFQSPFSLFQGELGFFDLMLQNLLVSSDETGEFVSQEGGPLPFNLFDANLSAFPAVPTGSGESLFMKIEDLSGFLEQFILPQFPGDTIPGIE